MNAVQCNYIWGFLLVVNKDKQNDLFDMFKIIEMQLLTTNQSQKQHKTKQQQFCLIIF